MSTPVSQADIKTSIILVTYNFEPWYDEFFHRVMPILAVRDDVELLIVENSSGDNTRNILRKYLFGDEAVKVAEWSRSSTYPNICLYLSSENTFFAGGNNIGFRRAMELDSRYMLLLNQDAFLRPGCLDVLEQYLDDNPTSASVQPVLMVAGTDRVNAAGVCLNYLQVGYSRDFNRIYDSRNYCTGERLNYAMAAGCLFRVAALRETGLFPEEYQMYHEDSHLQMKMKFLGYSVNLVNEPLIDHDYDFGSCSSVMKFFYIERNRLWNILTFYRWRTIAVLLPIMLVMEFGMTAHAFLSGWGRLKLKSWLAVVGGLRGILKHRREVQNTRKISDRVLLQELATTVDFEVVNSPALDLMNVLLRWYYRFVMMIVWW